MIRNNEVGSNVPALEATKSGGGESCRLVVTEEMLEAGVRVLATSGISDESVGADRLLVAAIYAAMSRASHVSRFGQSRIS